MGCLTTHILDTSSGRPAAGVRIELFRIDAGRQLLAEAVSNDDGRVESPLLEGEDFRSGEYELVFHAGDYFNAKGQPDGEHRFLDRVAIRFGINHPDQHYHVPLLLSPFGYSTYRGS